MVKLEERHLRLLKNILIRYDYSFYLFGSRASGNARPFSDIDIFYTETIPSSELLKLEEELEESDLPYKVDLVDYNTCDKEFQKILKRTHVCIQQGARNSGVLTKPSSIDFVQ